MLNVELIKAGRIILYNAIMRSRGNSEVDYDPVFVTSATPKSTDMFGPLYLYRSASKIYVMFDSQFNAPYEVYSVLSRSNFYQRLGRMMEEWYDPEESIWFQLA